MQKIMKKTMQTLLISSVLFSGLAFAADTGRPSPDEKRQKFEQQRQKLDERQKNFEEKQANKEEMLKAREEMKAMHEKHMAEREALREKEKAEFESLRSKYPNLPNRGDHQRRGGEMRNSPDGMPPMNDMRMQGSVRQMRNK